MRTTVHRSVLAALALLLVMLVGAAPARADAKQDIEKKITEAMDAYDMLEYEEARKILNGALAVAKKAKVQTDPVVAQVHLSLGIVYFAGLQDSESAKLAFLNAVEIDASVQIATAYKTADMNSLLEEARVEAGGSGGVVEVPDGGGGDEPGVDCTGVSGVEHMLVDTAAAGAPQPLTANVGAEVGAVKVSIMYRPQGAADFLEAKMTKQGDCSYAGAIPADGLRGELLHYYIAAFNGAGKVIAGKGSSGSPNIMEISGVPAGAHGDNEDPLGGGGGASSAGVTGGVTVGPKASKLYLNIAVGTGIGFVTGKTEQEGNDVGCCLAPALLHVLPEIGFYVSPKTSISAAARIGFPIGANMENHSTAAPAVLLRVRHSLGDGQDGVQVVGSIGGGVMRNTIKLTMAPAGMDTDIVAMGPLLVGAGAAYARSLGGPLKFVAEVNAIAGIPVIDRLGSPPTDFLLNFGVQVDANLGLMFGF